MLLQNLTKIQMKNSAKNRICVNSDFNELARIRDFVKDHAQRSGFKEKDAYNISLAVDEACSNLIKHAFYFDTSQQICIEIELNKNYFVINVIDKGDAFNPLDVPQKNMKEYLTQYNRGGLGIHIMRSVMDDISYTPSSKANSQNILKLKKIMN